MIKPIKDDDVLNQDGGSGRVGGRRMGAFERYLKIANIIVCYRLDVGK